MVAALEGRTAALMASHGAVTVGPDAAAAMDLALLLEWAATVYLNAARAGEPHVLDQAERTAVIEAVVARGYGSTKPVDEGDGSMKVDRDGRARGRRAGPARGGDPGRTGRGAGGARSAMTAAGSAGGTALTLAKLGAQT